MQVKKNILMLLIVNASNYIFPLLTFPYITKILGPENFGKIGLAQAIIVYATFVVDFGFNLTATREISIAKDGNNQLRINEIYTEVIFAKICLAIIAFSIILLLSFVFQQLEQIRFLLLIGGFSLVGAIFFPLWLFQGLQRMSGIVVATTIAKTISTVMIFITVHEQNDVNWVMLSQCLGGIVSAGIAIALIRRNRYASFVSLRVNSIVSTLKLGFPIFISYIFSSIYTTLNIFICSFFVAIKDVGYYSSADRIRQISQTVISPVQQAVYPHIAACAQDLERFKHEIKIYGSCFIGIGACISLVLFFCDEYIVNLVLGEQYLQVIPLIRIISILPFIVTIAIVFGQWGLINLKKEKLLSKIYVYGGLSHLFHIFIFLNLYGIQGAAYSVVITESLVTCVIVFLFFRVLRRV